MSDPLREGRHEDQLSPVAIPYHNSVLKGPKGTDVGDLSCYVGRDENGWATTLSHWAFDDRTRAMVTEGASIRLAVWQHPIPPLAVAVEPPWCERRDKHPDTEPVEKAWTGDRFVCPHCEEDTSANRDRDDAKRGHLDELRRDFRPDEPDADPDE